MVSTDPLRGLALTLNFHLKMVQCKVMIRVYPRSAGESMEPACTTRGNAVFAIAASIFALVQGTAMFALIASLFTRFGAKDVYEDYLASATDHAEFETRLRHIERATSAVW